MRRLRLGRAWAALAAAPIFVNLHNPPPPFVNRKPPRPTTCGAFRASATRGRVNHEERQFFQPLALAFSYHFIYQQWGYLVRPPDFEEQVAKRYGLYPAPFRNPYPCTVVLKPSEIAPLCAHVFAEILEEAGVPKGVFNLVDGDGPTVGEALARHPDVDMISFTGSTRAGIQVAKMAADTVKRVSQELGGKSDASRYMTGSVITVDGGHVVSTL